MPIDVNDLLPTRLLRAANPPRAVDGFGGVQIDDPRLAAVLSPSASLIALYQGTVHAEGPAWQDAHGRLVWSDVPNRRLLGWYPDGHVEVLIDGTWFMNGNAVQADGTLVHCEHGRRCISRGGDYDTLPEPIVTHYDGKRLNSPNDVAVAPDGAIWFTDPMFGILMPNQGALAEPELDHCSVYRFDPQSGELHRMADFEQPNGLAFSSDGATLYVSDASLSLGDVPGQRAGRLRCRARRHAVEPAFLLPYRSWRAGRFCGRRARLGVGRRRRRHPHLVARALQAGLHSDPDGSLELHVRRRGRAPPVHHRERVPVCYRPDRLNW
jgi:gluconolactonase